MQKRQLIGRIRYKLRQATGREYRINFEPLDVESLRELLRALDDAAHDKMSAVRRAQMMPWRRL